MYAYNFLILAAALFSLGVFGVIARRNAVMVLMSIELILNSVNLNLIAFALMNDTYDGHVFALFVMCVWIPDAPGALGCPPAPPASVS